jgi:hypothetical protein
MSVRRPVERKFATLEEVTFAIAEVVNEIRQTERHLCTECGLKYVDPLADVRIRELDDHVEVTYDGSGYEYFSRESFFEDFLGDRKISFSPSEKWRRKIAEKIKDVRDDLYIEDATTWSFRVYV